MSSSSQSLTAASTQGKKAQALNHGLLVTLDAKAGKQDQVATLLSNALNAAARESGTVTWYAYRITDTKFGIFDTFVDEHSRHAHLQGDIARALEQVGADVLDGAPQIQPISIVAAKI